MSNIIRTNCPPRAEDQQSVLLLCTAPLDVVRVGFVGLGERGMKAVRRFCDIGHACVYFASDESEFVSGQVINVDGGMNSHAPTVAQFRAAGSRTW